MCCWLKDFKTCILFGSDTVVYISKYFVEHLASSESVHGNGISFATVLLEDRIQLTNSLRLEGGDPVSKGNGILHRGECTGCPRRIKLGGMYA